MADRNSEPKTYYQEQGSENGTTQSADIKKINASSR